jgi:hypothetical protein
MVFFGRLQPDDQPIGTDAPSTVAEPTGDIGLGHHPVIARFERDEEVIAESVVLGESQHEYSASSVRSGGGFAGSASHRSPRPLTRRDAFLPVTLDPSDDPVSIP